MRHPRSYWLALALTGGLGLSACRGEAPSAPTAPKVASVFVIPASHTMVFIGERAQLAARALDPQGLAVPDQTFTWAVSDTSVAMVDTTGGVVAKRAGTVTVTASTAGVKGAATIAVNPDLASTRCVVCHSGGGGHLATAFPGTSCPACHLSAFTNPFTAHGVPTRAHVTVAGGFDLIGAHDTLPCARCHDMGSGAPLFAPRSQTDCIVCHQANYQAQHGAIPGWPTTCLLCHTTASFNGAVVDHTAASGGFPLVGAHTQLACTKCHDAATWTPLFAPQSATDCIACHQANYQAQHGATPGWPTTCLLCHTTTSFAGATFDHDGRFFPIFSGEHAGKWTATGCQTCHIQPSDYAVFSCFACHEHNRDAMDSEHRDRAGYAYDSKACLGCHPRP